MMLLGLSGDLASAIRSQKLARDPFPYLLLDGIFPDDLYASMQRNLPPLDRYRPYPYRDSIQPDGSCTRYMLHLHDSLAGLDHDQQTLWGAIRTAFASEQVRRAFFVRLGVPASTRCHSTDINLVRDLSGYKINPHPDGSDKIVTVQIYLGRGSPELGTELYRRAADGFAPVIRVPYQDNFGYAFMVAHDTFHGLPRITLPAGESRNSLMVIYRSRQG